jgi:hypothetical protein
MSHSDKCTVVAVASKRSIEAEVMAFNEGRNLTVVLNKSIKLMMQWNGRCYEAKNAGIDFESSGPKLLPKYNSPRGNK